MSEFKPTTVTQPNAGSLAELKDAVDAYLDEIEEGDECIEDRLHKFEHAIFEAAVEAMTASKPAPIAAPSWGTISTPTSSR